MKYIVVLCDGMADKPIEKLDYKTPLHYAVTPMMDELAGKSEIGMVHTIPDGMSPGSDTANLSVLGYDPRKYYTGRSPLEALSIGVDMKPTDVALRCNLVTLSAEEENYEDKTIIDHSSSEIDTAEASVLLEAVREKLEDEIYKFYLGTSYRHLTIWDKGEVIDLTAPHDILGQRIGEYLPQDKVLYEMQKKSYEILSKHSINVEREKRGQNPANSLWFWGAGTRPMIDSFEEKTGKKGCMISAVDLLKGIAVGAGMKIKVVEGATGGLDTNYEGKADAAVRALTDDGCDFVYVHIEAPDEMGHQGSFERKVAAIEYIDSRIIQPMVRELERQKVDFRMLVLPDHPTPVSIRTHTSDPVPYMLYDSTEPKESKYLYNEADAEKTGIYVDEGCKLIEKLFLV